MELVDPNIPPSHPNMYQFYASNEIGTERREGWGSAEATEMVLNNIFYITAKFGDSHSKEVEEVWGTLCTSWPNNMKVIIRYLIIISGMAPSELLPFVRCIRFDLVSLDDDVFRQNVLYCTWRVCSRFVCWTK